MTGTGTIIAAQIKYTDSDEGVVKRGTILDKVIMSETVFNIFLFFTWQTKIAVTYYLVQPKKEEQLVLISPLAIESVLTTIV